MYFQKCLLYGEQKGLTKIVFQNYFEVQTFQTQENIQSLLLSKAVGTVILKLPLPLLPFFLSSP